MKIDYHRGGNGGEVRHFLSNRGWLTSIEALVDKPVEIFPNEIRKQINRVRQMGKASGRGAVLVHTVDTHRQMNRWDNLLEKHQRQLSREALSPRAPPDPAGGSSAGS